MKMWNTKNKRNYVIVLLLAGLTVGLSYAVLLIAGEETQNRLTMEDGFFESVGAIGWLFASVVFFYIFWKDKNGNNFIFLRTKRNLFFCLLGLFCLIACGEEISWGQRIFDFQTPEFLKKINRQDETNLHNIVYLQNRFAKGEDLPFWVSMLSMTRIFQAFWFVYCVLLPFIGRFGRKIYYYIQSVNIPLVPIGLSAVFLANYLVSRVIPSIYNMSLKSSDHYFVEVKECNFGILFMLVSLYFLQNITNNIIAYNGTTDSLYESIGQLTLAKAQRSEEVAADNVFYKAQETQSLSKTGQS